MRLHTSEIVIFISILSCMPNSLAAEVEIFSAAKGYPPIEFLGLLELSAEYQVDPQDAKAEDDKLSLATLEIGMHTDLSDVIAADMLVAYQEDIDSMVLDVLTVNFANGTQPQWLAILGKNYLPFGSFATFQLNDTLGLELAETNQLFASTGYHGNYLVTDVYVYESEEGVAGKVGGRLGYHSDVFHFGIDYIDSLYDSPAYGIHGQWSIQSLTLMTEHVIVDHFKLNEVSHTEQYEVGYGVSGSVIAISYQVSKAIKELDLPQEKTSMVVRLPLSKMSQAGIELWKQDGLISFTVQLSIAWY
jgi:hypothetical protein